MNNRNILITGGAGFIGSHLAEYLLKNNYNVTIIDNLTTGSVSNIKHLKNKSNFRYFFKDVKDKMLLKELVDESDKIIHLAATVGVRNILDNPINTIENNIKATELVFELASIKKKRVIMASTSEVYGKSDAIPFREDDDIHLGPSINSRWSYATSKLVDEFFALAYNRESELPVTVVRLFNTVGPRQTGRYGMVIPTFVRQALRDKPITVYGDGKQTRCFCHVRDTIRAIFKLLDNKKSIGQVVNIGNEEEVSILELAERVKTLSKSDAEIKLIPYEEAYDEGFEDMRKRKPDLSKVKNLINFNNEYCLNDIIKHVIEYEKRSNQ